MMTIPKNDFGVWTCGPEILSFQGYFPPEMGFSRKNQNSNFELKLGPDTDLTEIRANPKY